MIVTTPLWKHQQAAKDFLKSRLTGGKGYGALFMDVGTGKTLTTLATISELGMKRVLVVTVDKAVSVWRKDIDKHTDKSAVVLELNGMTVVKRKRLLQEYKDYQGTVFVIINYEGVWREPLATALLNFGFDVMVTDEAHKIKAHNSKQSKFCAKLGTFIKARIALTATPFHNSPLDIFGIARYLDGSIFGKAWYRFKERYGLWSGFNGYVLIKYINLDELHSKVNEFSFTVNSSVLDLPEEHTVTRTVTMPASVRKLYKQFAQDFIVSLDGETMSADNVLVKLLRLHQLTGGYLVTDGTQPTLVDDFKGKALTELLDSFNLDEPLVIFYKFHTDMHLIAKAVEDSGRKWGAINGTISQYEEWGRGDFPVVLVQVSSGSAGIDFTRARYSIFYSMGFSLGDFTQAKGRLHRPGQSNQVTHIMLTVTDSIDTYISEAISGKVEPISYITSRLRGFTPNVSVPTAHMASEQVG